MERVSGWYKRRAQIILFVIGVALAILLNASAITAADRLWKDDGLRKGLVAQVEHQQEETTGTDALDSLENLNFPIGWEEVNSPDTGGDWLLEPPRLATDRRRDHPRRTLLVRCARQGEQPAGNWHQTRQRPDRDGLGGVSKLAL